MVLSQSLGRTQKCQIIHWNYLMNQTASLHSIPHYSNLAYQTTMNFPSCALAQPGPVLTPNRQEEWLIHDIIDERVCGCGMQYLVHWVGWGDEEN